MVVQEFFKEHMSSVASITEVSESPLGGFNGLLPNYLEEEYIGVSPSLETSSYGRSGEELNQFLEQVFEDWVDEDGEEFSEPELLKHSEAGLTAVQLRYSHAGRRDFDICGIYDQEGRDIWPQLMEAHVNGLVELSDRAYNLTEIASLLERI